MLNAEVTGSGKPLVFLHGYGENLTLWNNIGASLSNSYKVIQIDLPGFGKSAALDAPFTMEDIAHNINSFLSSEYNISEYTVFGHSLGGYITLALKELYPDAIAQFGLINSTAYADTDEKKTFRKKTADFIAKNGSAFFLKSFVPNLFLPKNQKVMFLEVENVLAMGNNLPESVLISYMEAMGDRKDRSHLLGQSENILFVGGRHDQLISTADIESQINLLKSSSEAHIFDDVAHMSMIESPLHFKTVIFNFLENIKSN